MAFYLYLLFTISWFLHLSARYPVLGAIRIDLLLVALIAILIVLNKSDNAKQITSNSSYKILLVLTAYAIVTVPLVEWPGSVIKFGLPNFIRAVVFYYFTAFLVTSEKKLKIFLAIFLSCQTIRVIEPVYLHITEGYWGSIASMADWQYMSRLSGAPNDIVNPNGLAFIIDSILPFSYYLSLVSRRWAVPLILTLPVLIYALVLTASRSGFLGMMAILFAIWFKSKKKLQLTVLFGVVALIVFSFLNANQRDRYLSIFSSHTKNAATAEGRISGMKENFSVAMRKPFFGHGLGTSREANANFGSEDKPAHNLWAEIAQELGFFGLVIFIYFVKSIITNFDYTKKVLAKSERDRDFLQTVSNAMQVWLFMNILFSFASYGLSSYEWYLFAGFSAVLTVIAKPTEIEASEV